MSAHVSDSSAGPSGRAGKPAADVILERVVKRYEGGVVAVKAIDLAIKSGEFVVLVGPSGCGKTTTLRMIAGLEDITEGTLKIGDRVMNDVAPRDRDIAMVFQSYALYPHMTVRENMAFGLELRKMEKSEIARRVNEAAKVLGLGDLLDRKPKALSGGQRQRVAMGRAIVRQPSVFLFDEPLSNLDAKLRVQMRLEIASLHRRVGATMVYVTHDQVEAMTLADRIAVMSMGELQQCDTPMDVYLKPKNKFVAGFIGSPAMNFIDGELTTVDGRLAFTCPGLTLPLSADHAARLSSRNVSGKVTLGVRPQHLHRGADGGSGEGVVGSGRVIHVELMGTESFVHLELVDATGGTGGSGPML
ncbi:MAG TPA: sn-glycerol-3-phosphate ABC transporter ATP-binding protein UgpC, partial [Myxococcota bacterium]|nr:sn-glycerol-3-phosphate ABC transporter ATP-binding protein UgpC [Myxococcota bacterium]